MVQAGCGQGVGLPEAWPRSLTTAVRILLTSRFAMWMAWGEDLTFFCNAAYRDGAISGQWTEASRNAAGTISGRADGDHVEAAAQGQNFSANLSLTTRGNRQTVSIRPEGSDVRAVSLALERR